MIQKPTNRSLNYSERNENYSKKNRMLVHLMFFFKTAATRAERERERKRVERKRMERKMERKTSYSKLDHSLW